MHQATVSFARERAPEQPVHARERGANARLPPLDARAPRAEVVMLLLFLHARPCRAYTPAYLEKKLGFSCVAALEVLLREGLVAALAGEPLAFTYGAEEPRLLAAVDELSRCYHGIAALLQLMAALVRARPAARRVAHPARLTKPKQGAPLPCSNRASARRAPRLRKRFPCLG